VRRGTFRHAKEQQVNHYSLLRTVASSLLTGVLLASCGASQSPGNASGFGSGLMPANSLSRSPISPLGCDTYVQGPGASGDEISAQGETFCTKQLYPYIWVGLYENGKLVRSNEAFGYPNFEVKTSVEYPCPASPEQFYAVAKGNSGAVTSKTYTLSCSDSKRKRNR
jgi:hypothetical protein